MAIQYGNMNPYAGLAGAVATGMELGMRDRTSQVVIPDPDKEPGLPPQPKPITILKDEMKELEIYSDYHKRTNKPDYNAEDRGTLYASLLESKGVKTNLIRAAVEANIDPSKIKKVFDKVSAEDPTAQTEILALSKEFNKAGFPMGSEAIKEKMAQYGEMGKEYATVADKWKQDRILKVKTAVYNIEKVMTDSSNFTDNGRKRMNPETMNVVAKLNKFLGEWAQLDPAGFVAERGAKQGRGGSEPTITTRMSDDPVTGGTVYSVAGKNVSPERVKRNIIKARQKGKV